MGASCNDVAALLLNLGALPPNPRDLPHYPPEWLVLGGTGYARPRAIPAPESALGLHLCVALSSAQVLPGWTTSTSPCNDFSANGDYPLNFVSHSKGSLHIDSLPSLFPPSGEGLTFDSFRVDQSGRLSILYWNSETRTVDFATAAPVPEPAAIVLAAIGLCAILGTRLRRLH